jgi:hypothetical protein
VHSLAQPPAQNQQYNSLKAENRFGTSSSVILSAQNPFGKPKNSGSIVLKMGNGLFHERNNKAVFI